MLHFGLDEIQFLLVQADFLADGSRAIRHDKTLLSQYNGHFFSKTWQWRKENFENEGITAWLPFTLQRTFLSQNAGIEMRNFQKNAPLLLRKRERVVSADMRFERIASTSGVRTHRENERFSLAADTPILIFGKAPNPCFLG